MTGNYKYKAFISYAHDDERFVERLHARLEKYRIPRRLISSRRLTGNRFGPIFRDRDELASSSSLTDAIRQALVDAEYLIVVCSRAAATSRWVNEEITAFQALRESRYILLIITDNAAPDATTELFPEAIRRAEEPLAADARATGDGTGRAFLKLAAGLIGVGFDELQQRHAIRQRRRLTTTAGAAIAIIGAAGLLVLQTQRAEQEATARRDQASALVAYMVDDLGERLAEYEKVGELDAGLTQALNYFATIEPSEMDDDTLEKYRVALLGVGSVRVRQGKLEDALAAFERAAELSRTHVTRQADNAEYWYQLAQNTYYIGEAYWEMQDVPAAAEKIELAMKRAQRAAELEPDRFPYQIEVIFALNNIGAVNTRLQLYDKAVDALLSSLELNRTLRERSGAEHHLDLLEQEVESVSWLAEIAPTLGEFEDAFRWHERELELRQRLFAETGNIRHQARLSDALGYYARTLSAVGRSADALRTLERKIEISSELIRSDPGNVFWRTRLEIGRLLLAVEVYHSGDQPRALSLTADAEAGLRTLLQEDRNSKMVALHLEYGELNRAYFQLRDDPLLALKVADEVVEELGGSMDEIRTNPVAMSYYLRAVVIRCAAARSANQPTEQALIASTLTLIEEQGESETSVYDAAYRALLLLASNATDAQPIVQKLNDIGFQSVFYREMVRRLTRRHS